MKLILSLSLFFCLHAALTQESFRYNHILITNDDGIDDADRLLALAKSVKSVVKRVSIVVSSFDKSGTSNHTTFGKHQSTLEVTCEYQDTVNNISAYTMPGNPADCVLLGLNGLFGDDRPDLVLSGINGGANIGPGWFGSGTIGAVRTAAFLGVKGIALSGFEDDDQRSFTLIPNWITRFISSPLINEMDKNSYLTVGFPKSLEAIKGIKLASRRTSLHQPERLQFQKIHGEEFDQPENTTVWALSLQDDTNANAARDDQTYLEQGYIVITPMSIDENHNRLMKTFSEMEKSIPAFSLEGN